MPIMTVTAGDLIRGAMGKIRALGVGETPSAEDAEDCLAALNDMLDTWSTEQLIVYALSTDQKVLTIGQANYTIGAGGDINTTRPDSIIAESSFLRDSNGYDTPLKPLTKEQYNAIPLKSTPNGPPGYVYYDPTYPLGTIFFFYPPDQAYTANIVSAKPFTAFADISADVAFPPSYVEAMKFSLAVRIAPMFGKVVAPDVLAFATNLKAAIKSRTFASRPMTANVNDLPCGVNGQSGRNIYTL